jgi:hypothetical protein
MKDAQNLIDRVMAIVQMTVKITGHFSESLYILTNNGITRIDKNTRYKLFENNFNAICDVTLTDNCYKVTSRDAYGLLQTTSTSTHAPFWNKLEWIDDGGDMHDMNDFSESTAAILIPIPYKAFPSHMLDEDVPITF